MHATFDIDDEVLTTAQNLAARRSVSLNTVMNDLLRAALRPQIVIDPQLGLPVFVAAEGSPPMDLAKIDKALSEEF